MSKKYLYIILVSICLLICVGYYLNLQNQQKISQEQPQGYTSTGILIKEEGGDNSSGQYMSKAPANDNSSGQYLPQTPTSIETQEYSFSNGKYSISFLASKNALVESRHAGDKKPTIQEMRDFLSTTSYQQSTKERLTTDPSDHCWYETYTGTYLSDPYGGAKDGKYNYSKEDIQKLTDKQIEDAYNGKGIRAEIQGTDYAPYPNFSILEGSSGMEELCQFTSSISYARNDGYSADFYIYSGKIAKKYLQQWKEVYEGYDLMGVTKDGYKQYMLTSARGDHGYYIQLDDGDIMTTGYDPFSGIRIHRVNIKPKH